MFRVSNDGCSWGCPCSQNDKVTANFPAAAQPAPSLFHLDAESCALVPEDNRQRVNDQLIRVALQYMITCVLDGLALPDIHVVFFGETIVPAAAPAC